MNALTFKRAGFAALVLLALVVGRVRADVILKGDEQITVNSPVGNVTLYDTSRAFIVSGGTVNDLYACDSSTVNMSDGTVAGFDLSSFNSSTVNMSGGTVDGIMLNVCDSSHVTFSGQDFSLGVGLTLAGEQVLGTGILGGKWIDGTPWSVNVSRNDPEATLRVTGVPEPSTLALLGTGAIALAVFAWRRRKAA